MVQTWKPANSIGNYSISLRSVKTKKHHKLLKNFSKTELKTLAAKSSSLGSIFAPKLSLGASQGGPRASPGSPQGAQRRLQAASVAPVCLPWAPLVSPWLPLNTAQVPPRAVLGAWGAQMFGFTWFWDSNIALLHRHTVTLSLDDIITSSNYHTTTLSHCHIFISSH